MDRRTFFKAIEVIGAVATSGLSISSKPSAKTVGEPTYKKFVVGEIPRYDATNHVFSRMAYDPNFTQFRGIQGRNMKETLETNKPGYGLMEMGLGEAWATFEVDCTHCISVCTKNRPPVRS